MTLLMLLSAVVGLVFLLALAFFANRIAQTLEAIGHHEPSSEGRVGASMSLLARIAFGVGAIERQCSHLPPQAGRLNKNLEDLAAGLVAVRDCLGETLEAAGRQEG